MTASPVILIAGTHGLDDPWWTPNGALCAALQSRGFRAPDPHEPYQWDTRLDGLTARHDVWQSAGRALHWYAQAKATGPVSAIAHSHGGQVLAYAAVYGMRFDRVVTVATPVRADMKDAYWMLSANSEGWTHIHSDGSDWWQALGEMADGRIGVWREMAHADRNIGVPRAGHSGTLAPEMWDEHGWWELLGVPR